MSNAVTFVVPVCHPANARNWDRVKLYLEHTARSIAAQTSSNWKAVVVANRGADLPVLPAGVEVHWVEFEPNPVYDSKNKEQLHDGIRFDKGRRVLAGMLSAGEMGHAMVVDGDDLISDRICAFVEEHREEPGWYVANGYAYQDGGSLLVLCSNFHKLCGTSLIVRSDLFQLPRSVEEASGTYIRQMLGSHIYIVDALREAGQPLRALPFAGAVYRMAHSDSVTNSKGLMRSFLLNKAMLKRPGEQLRRLRGVRRLTAELRSEYFGEPESRESIASSLR